MTHMAIKQRQYLLLAMGYSPGVPDGVWGENSKAACMEFQKDIGGLTVDGIYGKNTDAAMVDAISRGWYKPTAAENKPPAKEGIYGSRYFTRQEFACKCGNCGGFPAEPSETLVRKADSVRTHFGRAITISSGVRCPARNKAVGGVANSYHLSGRAMDFCVDGVDGETVLNYVKTLGMHYAYHIGGGYVHMDI